jgi:hypothetical protein
MSICVCFYQSVQEIDESVLTIQQDQFDQPLVILKSDGSKSYVLLTQCHVCQTLNLCVNLCWISQPLFLHSWEFSNSMWLIDMLLIFCCLPLAIDELQVNVTIETVPPPGGNAMQKGSQISFSITWGPILT